MNESSNLPVPIPDPKVRNTPELPLVARYDSQTKRKGMRRDQHIKWSHPSYKDSVFELNVKSVLMTPGT
jgi:hypothetical protein